MQRSSSQCRMLVAKLLLLLGWRQRHLRSHFISPVAVVVIVIVIIVAVAVASVVVDVAMSANVDGSTLAALVEVVLVVVLLGL